MSATPRLVVLATSGRLRPPLPELSWRTRREMRFTSTLGLPTFSAAFLQSSEFTILVREIEQGSLSAPPMDAIRKFDRPGNVNLMSFCSQIERNGANVENGGFTWALSGGGPPFEL